VSEWVKEKYIEIDEWMSEEEESINPVSKTNQSKLRKFNLKIEEWMRVRRRKIVEEGRNWSELPLNEWMKQCRRSCVKWRKIKEHNLSIYL
jgi:hypothetical protein